MGARFGHFWCPKTGPGEKTCFFENLCFSLVKAMFLRVQRPIWATKSELLGDLFPDRFPNTLFITFMLILAPFRAPFGALQAPISPSLTPLGPPWGSSGLPPYRVAIRGCLQGGQNSLRGCFFLLFTHLFELLAPICLTFRSPSLAL